MVCIYVDATLSVHPTLSFPLCVHKSMPYFCISIPALQIGSSGPMMEYYSAIKRNNTGSFVVMWMNVYSVIQREVSQKEKNKYHILMHVYGSCLKSLPPQ